MVERCHNPKSKDFSHYGARGIAVCDQWRASYLTFAGDVGERPSPLHVLDRIDNDRGYYPDNVRWVTQTENNRNRRNSVSLTVRGETMPLVEWSKRTGIAYPALLERLAARVRALLV
jgi:hypothetical protein